MTEQDWWGHFHKGLPDEVTAFAFADWLEERGDARAAAVRWIVGRGLEPKRAINNSYLSYDGPSWNWKPTELFFDRRFQPVPSDVLVALEAPKGAKRRWKNAWVWEYPSAVTAFMALVDAYTKVKASSPGGDRP